MHLAARSTVLLFVILFALASTAIAADRAELEAKLKSANERLQTGQVKEAIALYDEILAVSPRATTVWLLRAIGKWNQEDIDGAMADIEEVLRLDENNADAYRLRAEIRLAEAYFYEAEQDIDRAIKLQPDFATAHYIRSRILWNSGGAEFALPAVERAVELKPDYPEALRYRILLFEELGKWPEIVTACDGLLAVEPKDYATLAKRGWARFRLLQWDEALSDARAALELAPRHASAASLVGYAAFAHGEPAAVVALEKAAELAGPEPEKRVSPLLLRHFALRRAEKADVRLARAAADWPEDSWARTLAAFIEGKVEEEKLLEQAEDTEDFDELEGRRCQAHFYLGLLRLIEGKADSAAQHFRESTSAGAPEYVEHTLALGELKRIKH